MSRIVASICGAGRLSTTVAVDRWRSTLIRLISNETKRMLQRFHVFNAGNLSQNIQSQSLKNKSTNCVTNQTKINCRCFCNLLENFLLFSLGTTAVGRSNGRPDDHWTSTTWKVTVPKTGAQNYDTAPYCANGDARRDAYRKDTWRGSFWLLKLSK